MEPLDRIDRAAGRVRDALRREIAARGKPGHDAELKDWREAINEFEEAVRVIDEERDA